APKATGRPGGAAWAMDDRGNYSAAVSVASKVLLTEALEM
ncbi:hypothetical protein SAMN05877831_11451, partial [Rhodobacter maris]